MTPSPLRPVLLTGAEDAATIFAAVAAAGVPMTVLSPPGAGALWFRTLVERATGPYPGLRVTAILDCGDRAGEAQGALAAGIGCILFRGHPAAAERLSRIAAERGAVVLTELPLALDLRGVQDPTAALTAWLSGTASAGG